METTANAFTLKIEGMTGDPCVQKVKSALAGVPGCKVESVKVGEAFCNCDDPSTMDKACAAVKSAGYKATATGNNERSGKQSQQHDSGKHQSRESQAMTSEGAGGAIDANAGAVKTAPAQTKKHS